MAELTERQRAVFEFIRGYIKERGIAPSYDEIRQAFHFRSYNSVRKHLKRLEERGVLKSPWNNKKRALVTVTERRRVSFSGWRDAAVVVTMSPVGPSRSMSRALSFPPMFSTVS